MQHSLQTVETYFKRMCSHCCFQDFETGFRAGTERMSKLTSMNLHSLHFWYKANQICLFFFFSLGGGAICLAFRFLGGGNIFFFFYIQ